MHLYRLHSSWDAWRQRRSCDDDSSSLSPACSCGFQTRTDLQLEVVGPETHLVCIRGAADAVAADASGLPKRNQVGETHLCDGQAPLRQTWAPLPGACPPGPQLCTAAEMLTTKAFAHPCCVHDCMSRAAARDMVSCERCKRLIKDIHNIVTLAFAGKDAPVKAQQHWTIPSNTGQYRALPKGHIWVPSSRSGEHAHVHCAPLTLVSMLVCIAPP